MQTFRRKILAQVGRACLLGFLIIHSGLAASGADTPPLDNFHPSVGSIRSLLAQPDGKIVIGGSSFLIQALGVTRIARLTTDGNLEPTFLNPYYFGDGVVIALVLQAETGAAIQVEGGRALPYAVNIADVAAIQAMVNDVVAAYGRIDILVNNAGVVQTKPMLELDEADWDRVMNVNVKGLYHTCPAVLPQMLRQGSGSVLNISSVGAVLDAYPKLFIYTISKSAVNTFTRCLAAEFAPKGIRVNCIMPGMIDSPPIYKEILPLYGGDVEKMRKDRNE